MSRKRLTDTKPPLSLGTFKPTDHVVAAFADDAGAGAAAQALRDAGIAADDIAQYSAAEMHEHLTDAADNASGAAGFGYEISLVRRWQELARQDAGWLLVYSPDDDATEKVKGVLQRCDAKLAVKYHLLVIEDLV